MACSKDGTFTAQRSWNKVRSPPPAVASLQIGGFVGSSSIRSSHSCTWIWGAIIGTSVALHHRTFSRKRNRHALPEQTQTAERPVIVLLQPPGACSEFTRSGSKYPPLGLCQIAATVEASKALVLDADGLGLTFEETIKRISEINPVAVGMTITSYTFDMINQYTEPLKALGKKVLIGGPQATLDPKGTVDKCPNADWVVRGEAEMIFVDVVQRLKEGQSLNGLPGVCWRGPDGAAEISSQSPIVPDLNMLPLPRLDGLPLRSYWCPDAQRLPMMTMMTARGCPHRCGFCSSPSLYGQTIRAWSINKVLDYIEECVAKFGIKEISFVDDVFTIPPGRLKELCEGIIERKLDVSWFCNSRADQVNEELAELAKRAGCHQMYLGFESGDPKILKIVKKDTTIEKLEKGAAALQKYGIHRSVGFVVGLPGEDENGIEMSIAMAKRVRAERLQFTRWTPLVGSALYDGISGSGFHSSITTEKQDEFDKRVQKMYAECGRGTFFENKPESSKAAQTTVFSDKSPQLPFSNRDHLFHYRIFHLQPSAFMDIFPHADMNTGNLTVIMMTLQTRHSQASLSRDAQIEFEKTNKELMLKANTFRDQFLGLGRHQGALFCDFVDPRSGYACHSIPGRTFLARDARYECLGLEVREFGCCPVLWHPDFGACMVSLPIFCIGSTEVVQHSLNVLDQETLVLESL